MMSFSQMLLNAKVSGHKDCIMNTVGGSLVVPGALVMGSVSLDIIVLQDPYPRSQPGRQGHHGGNHVRGRWEP